MKSLEKIKTHLKEYSYLKSLEALHYWDMETMMPEGAISDRAERLSYLQGKIHSHIVSKKYEGLLSDFKAEKKLGRKEKKLLKELEWDLNRMTLLPKSYVMELSHTQTIATQEWARARKNNDWSVFRPHLEKLINLKKQETKFFKERLPYDSLLKSHDKEFSSVQVQDLFNELKIGLAPIVARVKKDKKFIAPKELKGKFSIEAQKELSLYIANSFGLAGEKSRLDISTHPFSITISPNDQRITTRFNENDLDSLSSTMHEVGHALYEAGLSQEWEGTPFAEAISLSVHESQSRFWENVIGRSREFSEFIHPKMVQYFPIQMKDITKDDLFYYFNKSIPGLIRVESCELYYNYHVIIRFEIEKLIFNENLKVDELPKIWNKLYKDYLGITPKTNQVGILQDSHWAGGAFGYFPTYTLGNLISGSLYYKMKKDLPTFSKDIKKGDFTKVLQYLRQNIHSQGRSINSTDIVGKLSSQDYLSYLKEKFNG